jgi:PIN domain nuclease of toxin-antitoxin system
MVTYVLDSSTILRYLDGEAGAERVTEIIKAHLAGRIEAVISAVHWGEIAGITRKLHGKESMDLVLSRLTAFGLQVVAVDADRAVRAALIKFRRHISYVDSFAIELTAERPDRVFVTADSDFKPATRDVKIEFLPAK